MLTEGVYMTPLFNMYEGVDHFYILLMHGIQYRYAFSDYPEKKCIVYTMTVIEMKFCITKRISTAAGVFEEILPVGLNTKDQQTDKYGYYFVQ